MHHLNKFSKKVLLPIKKERHKLGITEVCIYKIAKLNEKVFFFKEKRKNTNLNVIAQVNFSAVWCSVVQCSAEWCIRYISAQVPYIAALIRGCKKNLITPLKSFK